MSVIPFRVTERTLRKTAAHEASHAVAQWMLEPEFRGDSSLEGISVRPQGARAGPHGNVGLTTVAAYTRTRGEIETRIVVLMAGAIGSGDPLDSYSATGDMEEARKLASKLVTSGSADRNLRRLERRTWLLVHDPRFQILRDALAAELFQRTELNGGEVVDLLQQTDARERRAIMKPVPDSPPLEEVSPA